MFPMPVPGRLRGGEAPSLVMCSRAVPSSSAKPMVEHPRGVAYVAERSTGELSELDGGRARRDFILTNATIYWVTNTAGSSIRFYYEDAHTPRTPVEPTNVPTGVAGFAGDLSGIRRFAERDHNLVQWHLYDAPAGHYAAHQATQVLVEDMRAFFRKLRGSVHSGRTRTASAAR
jgi:hypothetical protein